MDQQKHVLVSGGTSGIGLAIANGFYDAGWQVTATGLNAHITRDIQSDREGLSFVELDVTDLDSVEDVVGECSGIDALVNAAGIIQRIEEFQLDVFEKVVNVNLHGTMRLCTAAKDKLMVSRGSIVNIASMLTFFGGGLVPAYAASKGGVAQLTKSLAIAWARDGIRVNAIAPGWIETPMTEGLRNDPHRNAVILSRTPLDRWGKPEELVGPVLFLVSDAASFVTGAVLTVDGGYSIM